jgi:serine/threonine protein kinase
MVPETIKHYHIEEQLGQGGMGVVYKARDLRLGRPVAVKVLKKELTGDLERKRRFLQEARSASAVTHPAIAQVYDVDEADDTLFIVLEYVEGQTVRALVMKRELDLLRTIEIAMQVAEGLSSAHGVGIVHRDVKSENIMVTVDGRVKILDFGLAKLLEPSGKVYDSGLEISALETMVRTQAGTVLGTVAYMSPEQARGRTVDHRSDIFSMGIVLYEMATGELPFRGASLLDTMHSIAFDEAQPVTMMRRNLPSDLQQILARCLRKSPTDRYQESSDLAADLKELKRTIESGPQPLTLAGQIKNIAVWRDGPKWRTWSMIAAGALGLVAILALNTANDFVGILFSSAFVGFLVYRFVVNRRNRTLKRVVSRISKVPEIKIIAVKEGDLLVIADRATSRLYLKSNGIVESANKKWFLGPRIKVDIQDNLPDHELRAVLREPGIRYVREGLVKSLDSED